MAALGRIRCAPIPLLEFVVGEVGFEVDTSWHASVLQLHAATPYHTLFLCLSIRKRPVGADTSPTAR
jgi:hypothetical protein